MVVDRPGSPDRRFPGWPGPVLVISVESQAVCAWGVPLGVPDPPVLVGGHVTAGDDVSRSTVAYATGLTAFVATRRWDAVCLGREPLLQAQAAELDPDTLAALRGRHEELPASSGWPGRATYRFQRRSVTILLWDSPGQCDWWISAADDGELEEAVESLVRLSDLGESLWSDDPGGDRLLTRLRERDGRA